MVSNWELSHSLIEDAISGAEIAPFRLWLPPACLPASGGGWAGPQPASSPLVFAQSFVLRAGRQCPAAAAAAAKSLQSCPTLCDLIDGSPPGSSVPGILQARTLEWVAISFSNA